MIEKAAVFMIRTVSIFFRALGWRACRFYPSCSEYGMEAFHKFSPIKALWLSTRRLLRCHPFSSGNIDPLPHSQPSERSL